MSGGKQRTEPCGRSRAIRQVYNAVIEGFMSTRTASYLEAVEHLPNNAVLVIEGVTWSEYEQLLIDLVQWPGMRVSYNRGRLEVVSPSKKHEKMKIFIHDLVTTFC